MQKILVVEDDRALNNGISLALKAESYGFMQAFDLEQARDLIKTQEVCLVILDLNLPDGNGLDFLKEIKEHMDIPVVILTARDQETEIVTGLELGADDYITKPFRPRELVARIKAAFRKSGKGSFVFEVGGLSVDTASGIVKKDGSEVFLSALEYRLLLVFVSNPRSIITRDRLLNELWDAAGEFVTNNALTVYIKRLREKIEEDPAKPQIILTVRGTGYRLGV